MGRKHTGKIIGLLALMFISSFGQTIETLLRANMDYDKATGYGLLVTFANMLLVSAVMMAVPGIVRLAKKEKLPHKSGKRLCVWNSIILFVLSLALQIVTEVLLIGGVGALIFYFINKWLFVSELQPTVEKSAAKQEDSADIPNPIDNFASASAEQPIHVCLSDENEQPRVYGNYNVYGSDIMLKKEPQSQTNRPLTTTPKASTTLAQPTSDKQKIRYCSRCGQIIDPVSKQCRGCGKQYFKGISLKTVLVVLASLLLIVSIVGNVVLCISNLELRDDVASLEKTNASLKKKNEELKEENDQYYDYWVDSFDEIAFYDEYVVFVEDDGTNLYHKYDCSKFTGDYFWAFNVDAAKDEGYKPCSRCCD